MTFVRNRAWKEEDPLLALKTIRKSRLERGEQLLDLSMINPDLPPPRLLMDRLMEASMKVDNHRYAVSRGVRKLREAFATKYSSRFGVALDPETEICVTMGTKDALVEVLQVVCAPGDTVLLPSPSYPAHRALAEYAGLRIAYFTLSPSEDEMLAHIKSISSEKKVAAILLNFPNNPTGISVSSRFWQALKTYAFDANIFILNDFAYGELGFSSAQPPSLLEGGGRPKGCAETYTLSKAYSVPGWRVGALSGDEEIVREVAKLKAHVDYGIFLPIQYAAAAALSSKSDLVSGIREAYERRCRLLGTLLSGIGCEVAIPSAGASVWIKLPRSFSGEECAIIMAEKHGILVMPGALFNTTFSDYVRIAVVAPEEKLRVTAYAFEATL